MFLEHFLRTRNPFSSSLFPPYNNFKKKKIKKKSPFFWNKRKEVNLDNFYTFRLESLNIQYSTVSEYLNDDDDDDDADNNNNNGGNKKEEILNSLVSNIFKNIKYSRKIKTLPSQQSTISIGSLIHKSYDDPVTNYLVTNSTSLDFSYREEEEEGGDSNSSPNYFTLSLIEAFDLSTMETNIILVQL